MEIPLPITLKTTEPLTVSENLNSDSERCYRLMSAGAAMQSAQDHEPVEVNGRWVLHEMRWRVLIFERFSPLPSRQAVGADVAYVEWQKEIDGDPTATFLTHIRPRSFDNLQRAALAAPRMGLTVSFSVRGVFHDSEKGVYRWLSGKTPKLEVENSEIQIKLDLSRDRD